MKSCLMRWGLVLWGVPTAGACALAFPEDAPTCEGWTPGEVVITELMPDPEGVDTGHEWMELYNPGPAAVDLQGLLLYAAHEDGSQEHAYLFEQSVPVKARSYVVLGDDRSEVPPAPLDFAYGDALGALPNAGGRVGLRCGDVLVDEVVYSKPGHSGVARSYDGRRVPDAHDNDDPTHWCDAPGSADGGVQGSPGAANPPCPSSVGDGGGAGGRCLSPRTGQFRDPWPPRPGDLRITEVMADPKAVPDAQGEWVELEALRDVDLNGVALTSEGGGQARFEASPYCLEMRAGSRALLAREADPVLNGGLPSVLGTFTFGLSNGPGSHWLRVSLEGAPIAEATWTGAPLPGVSWQLEAERFCAAPEDTHYGSATGDRGTPGEENRPCAP